MTPHRTGAKSAEKLEQMTPSFYTAPIDGVHLFASGFVLLAFFVAASFAAMLLLRTFNPREEDFPVLAAASFTVGPLLFALVLSAPLLLLDGLEPRLLLAVSGLVTVIPGSYAAMRFGPRLAGLVGRFATSLLSRPVSLAASLALVVALAYLIGAQIIIAFFQPAYANDTLEYLTAGRLVADAASLKDYPFIDSTRTGGFFGPWTHPPAYPVLIALAYWIQGSSEYSGIARLICPYFAAAQALLLIAVANAEGRRVAGLAAAVLCLSTPLYFLLNSQAHIDSVRIAAFSAAAATVWLAARRPGAGAAVAAGLAVGVSEFSHSIGLLTLGFVAPLFLIASSGPLLARLRSAAIFVAIGGALAAPFLLRNLRTFGSFLQDNTVLWTFAELDVEKNRALERGIYTFADKIFAGALRPFSEIDFFGYVWWATLALSMVALYVARRTTTLSSLVGATSRSSPLALALMMCVGFLAFQLLTVAMGTDLAIKNARYAMTSQPFACLAAALLLTWPFDRQAREAKVAAA